MNQINLENWDRKDIFNFFSRLDYPFYSVTIPIDVTELKRFSKQNELSFYHLMIWVVTKAINSVPAFNVRIHDGKVYQHKLTHPSFTTMDKGSEVFKIVTSEWEEDYTNFCTRVKSQCEHQTTFIEGNPREDLIYISCTPWFDFTALTNERNFEKDDAIPRISWGKFYNQDDRILLHLSIDVNHRTIDGFHIGKFKEQIDKEISSL